MSIHAFIQVARQYDEEIDDYFKARPELIVALTSDAVSIDKLFEVVPSLAALLQKYGLTQGLRDEVAATQSTARPSTLRLLAQVFGHPWQHVNLEQALADAVNASRADFEQECAAKDGSCGDCDCEDNGEKPIMIGLTPEGDLAYTVSDVPLTPQEEATFYNQVEKVVAHSDPVNHPSHYTSNASGVEAIELTEKMSFNLGNAFKYVFRRDGKGNTLQDAKKAEWYLKREIGRLEALIDVTPQGIILMLHPSMTAVDFKKSQRVIGAETNPNAADFFSYLFDQTMLITHDDLFGLHQALDSLQELIADIKATSEQQG